MKNILTVLLLLAGYAAYGQHQRTYPLNEYNQGWALVKTISGTYGFVDAENNFVVQPLYKKIEKFGAFRPDWARVKAVTGTYGFIDRTGREVVPAIYDKTGKFGEYREDLALVRSLSGFYGFIDITGKEAIPAQYGLQEAIAKAKQH